MQNILYELPINQLSLNRESSIKTPFTFSWEPMATNIDASIINNCTKYFSNIWTKKHDIICQYLNIEECLRKINKTIFQDYSLSRFINIINGLYFFFSSICFCDRIQCHI